MTEVAVSKQRGRYSNHRPEFRTTERPKLFGAEREIGRLVAAILDRPVDFDGFVHGRVTPAEFRLALLNRALDEDTDSMRRAIFSAYQAGEKDVNAQIRTDVNTRLRELGSRARLSTPGAVRKEETLKVVWELPIETFDVIDPAAPASVQARFQSGNVLAQMAAETEASIGLILEDGFTASRTWATGRTSHGLTPRDQARALFAVLNDVTVNATGATYAAELGSATRGLGTSWAKAVERRGNAVAYRMMRAGATPEAAWARAGREMERHGTKLRRSRALSIARTETARAQNAAIFDGHRRAVSDGLVGANTEMEWITGPFDVCPICTPLGGTRRPINGGSWSTASGLPPAHPSCRCKTRLVPDIGVAPRRFGDGTFEDPFRYEFADGWSAPINPRK